MRQAADKIEEAMEDSRLIILLNIIPAAIFLSVMTYYRELPSIAIT